MQGQGLGLLVFLVWLFCHRVKQEAIKGRGVEFSENDQSVDLFLGERLVEEHVDLFEHPRCDSEVEMFRKDVDPLRERLSLA